MKIGLFSCYEKWAFLSTVSKDFDFEAILDLVDWELF
jgi:hypothetical protein